jgi:hypothetical protein
VVVLRLSCPIDIALRLSSSIDIALSRSSINVRRPGIESGSMLSGGRSSSSMATKARLMPCAIPLDKLGDSVDLDRAVLPSEKAVKDGRHANKLAPACVNRT